MSLDHLLPPSLAPNSQSGYALASSGDWLAVGARFDPEAAPGAGAVDLYERTLFGFEHRGRLLASDGAPGDTFGFSLSFDGNLLAVGAQSADVPLEGGTVENAGALYVFERTGQVFSQVDKLVSPEAEQGERLGENVLLVGDWLFGGMHVGDDVAPAPGRGHVFRRSGGRFQFHQYLVSKDAALGDHFAYSFALAPGGSQLLVGARNDDDVGLDAGSFYVFELEDGLWVEREEHYPSAPTTGAYFSAAFAFAGATTLLVGAPGTDLVAQDAGAVYVLERGPLDTWLETQILTPSAPVVGARFGTSVAAQGNWLLVGAPFDDPAPPASTALLSGALWLFERASDGTFKERARLTPASFGGAPQPGADGPAYFGFSAAISAPGSGGTGLGLVAGGAPNAPSVGQRAGYTAVFSHPETRTVGFYAGPVALSLRAGGTVGLELSGGGAANLAIDGGGVGQAAPSLAHKLHIVLGSAQPPASGAFLDGIALPLVPDAYTALGLAQANQAPFLGTLGLLDSGALALGALAIPAGSPPALAGLTLWHGALVFDVPGSFALLAASAPRPLLLTP